MRHKATAEADPRHAADNVEPFLPGAVRTVGEQLRNAREDLGLELHQVSEILRIRYAHLRAIEEGRASELPGQTYALGFVRTYAEYLGLDPRVMVERYKEEMSGIPRSTQLVFPTPKPEGKIPGGALVVISLLLVGLAYGGWYAFNEYEDQLSSLLVREAPPVSVSEPGVEPGQAPAAPPATSPDSASAPAAPESPQQAEAPTAGPADPETPSADLPASPEIAPAASEQPAEQLAMQPEPGAPAPEAQETTSEPSVPEATVSQPGAAQTGALQPATPETAAPADEAAEVGTADGSGSEQSLPEPPSVSSSAAPAVPATGGSGESAAQPEAQSAPEVAAPTESLIVLSPNTAASPGASQQRPSVSATQDAQAVPDVAPQPAAEPAPQTTVAREEGIPVPPVPEGASGDVPAGGRVFGTANTDARVVLRATADSWVQVRNANSDLLFTQVLRAGDSYNVPNQQGLTLLTGNAGGLQVLVDGRPAPSLGPSGAVRRDIELDPERLLQGAQ